MHSVQSSVPHTVRAAVAEAAARHFSTTDLNLAFEAAGFRPVAGGSKRNLARSFLKQLDDHERPWELVQEIIRSIFNATWEGRDEPEDRRSSRDAIVVALTKEGATFDGVRLIGLEVTEDSTLHDAVHCHDMATVRRSFERAAANIAADPEAALTAASSLLESLFKIILEDDDEPLPADQSIKSLWKAVRDHLDLAISREMETDMKTILGGLAAVVNGVGDLRTHAGDAHGRGRTAADVDARHARLAVSSAQAIAAFVLETWAMS